MMYLLQSLRPLRLAINTFWIKCLLMRNLSALLPAPISSLERHLPACFPAPTPTFFFFKLVFWDCFRIHFQEQHKLKCKKWKRLFMLSAPCSIYIGITNNEHVAYSQICIGRTGTKVASADEWIHPTACPKIMQKSTYLDNNRNVFTKPF